MEHQDDSGHKIILKIIFKFIKILYNIIFSFVWTRGVYANLQDWIFEKKGKALVNKTKLLAVISTINLVQSVWLLSKRKACETISSILQLYTQTLALTTVS